MNTDYFIKLIELLEKIKQEDLEETKKLISEKKEIKKKRYNKKKIEDIDQKRELIGNLPFILLSNEYFPRNYDVIKFAKRSLHLDINIRKNRSKAEMVGIIIGRVAELDDAQISKFNRVLNDIFKIKKNKVQFDFMSEWDKAIRELG